MKNDKNAVYFSSFRKDSIIDSFSEAVKYLKCNPETELIIEPGEYLISSEMAIQAQKSVMMGKFGDNPQKVMFNPKYEYSTGISIFNVENCSIKAYGVKLIIDGFMEPISIKNCRNVSISGFEISHKRKPFSRGTVISVTNENAIIEFDSDCPITKNTPMKLRYFFINPGSNEKIFAEIDDIKFVDSYHIKISSKELNNIHTEMLFYTVHTFHSRPALLIENSNSIQIEGLTIRNQPGMGIVGNRSENITIQNLKVIPENGYHISTNTDATHFTSMKGYLNLIDCIADGQGDDFTNIHAYYQKIVENLGECSYKIRENTPDGTHSQSIDFPDVGDILELSEYESLECCGEYKVEKVAIIEDENCCIVKFDRSLPIDTDKFVLSDITRLPEVRISGCECRNHFARSILIKCRKAIIENNKFSNILGPAVEIAAEAWWYEGVTPANITVRNNTIERCGIDWGEASGIVVKNDCKNPLENSIKNIAIEKNIINSENKHGIFCRNVEGLRINSNRIISFFEPIIVKNCSDVQIISEQEKF